MGKPGKVQGHVYQFSRVSRPAQLKVNRLVSRLSKGGYIFLIIVTIIKGGQIHYSSLCQVHLHTINSYFGHL